MLKNIFIRRLNVSTTVTFVVETKSKVDVAESMRTPYSLVISISIEEDRILSSFSSFIIYELRRRSISITVFQSSPQRNYQLVFSLQAQVQ